MAQKVIDFRKQIDIVVNGNPYTITLDRYSTIELSIALNDHRIDVYRRPRGGHPVMGIQFNPYKQTTLNFDDYEQK